jgi:O-antigen ligase
MLHNLFAFFVVLHIVAMPLARGENVRKNIYFYLFLVLLNSLYVIAEAFVTSKRAFGFAGIMFVDYVGIGLVIVTLLALTNRGARSLFYYFLGGVFSVALVLTQTRGVWLVTMTTIVLMIIYLLIRGRELGVSRRSVTAFCLMGAAFVLLVFGVVTYINPEISKRTEQVVETKQFTLNEEGATTSSLVTRVLVWNTAYNAFAAHPIVGIGAYGFPFSSRLYNSLPKVLFDRYVKGLTPHIGYLAVLTETGIVGFLGFIVFIIFGLKTVFKPLSSMKRTATKWSLIFAWTFVYIVISMFTTDAWLWGQGIILMAIVLGLGLANQRIVGQTKQGEAST